jgi:hypothetical protein
MRGSTPKPRPYIGEEAMSKDCGVGMAKLPG